ncbi:hypothetical protein BaRGS_00016850 [Batillaria attramentaria]|uniref:Uncharacterized protein n=1 Tax=Batillaria attramentaria TaxID=370345 RepID=A0ABD0KX06_9CAEN
MQVHGRDTAVNCSHHAPPALAPKRPEARQRPAQQKGRQWRAAQQTGTQTLLLSRMSNVHHVMAGATKRTINSRGEGPSTEHPLRINADCGTPRQADDPQ